MNTTFEKLLADAICAGMEAAAKVNLKTVCDGNGYVAVKLTINGKLAKYKWSSFAVWYAEREKLESSWIRIDGVRHDIPSLPGNIYNGVLKKEAYSDAFRSVINKAGFYAFPYTRLD